MVDILCPWHDGKFKKIIKISYSENNHEIKMLTEGYIVLNTVLLFSFVKIFLVMTNIIFILLVVINAPKYARLVK